MQSIQEALEEVGSLHQQLTQTPMPEIGPEAFLPIPPGVDPVAFAIDEVTQLKQIVEQAAAARPSATTARPTWAPQASVYAGPSQMLLQVELPGVAKDDLALTIAEGELVVRGERRSPAVQSDLRPLLVEQACGPFERRFAMPTWCRAEEIAARYEQGVLEVTMTRAEGGASGEHRVEIA